MNNLEHFNALTKQHEKTDIAVFKMIIAELQDNNPNLNLSWCLPKYRAIKEWLCSEKTEVEQ